MHPGEYLLAAAPVVCNEGRRLASLVVTNTGDRPIQVGSHFHFFEVNRALVFDRSSALGMRLNIPAGTAIRFEPGVQREVSLVEIAGLRNIVGLNGLTRGSVDGANRQALALNTARQKGFMKGGAAGAGIDQEGVR